MIIRLFNNYKNWLLIYLQSLISPLKTKCGRLKSLNKLQVLTKTTKPFFNFYARQIKYRVFRSDRKRNIDDDMIFILFSFQFLIILLMHISLLSRFYSSNSYLFTFLLTWWIHGGNYIVVVTIYMLLLLYCQMSIVLFLFMKYYYYLLLSLLLLVL